jgi:hypothetical protein
MTMRWQWVAMDMQNVCKCCTIHPKQQSLMWTVWGGGDKRKGGFGGIEPQKRVEVEVIEWRSVDLHSINSKSTFRPPQGSKHTGTYSACILGVRLRYRRHGKHVYWQ